MLDPRQKLERGQDFLQRCMSYLRNVEKNVLEANRLQQQGPSGYPGTDLLPSLSRFLGCNIQCVWEVRSSNGETHIDWGTSVVGGQGKAHVTILSNISVDPAGGEADHYGLLQSFISHPHATRVSAETEPYCPILSISSRAPKWLRARQVFLVLS